MRAAPAASDGADPDSGSGTIWMLAAVVVVVFALMVGLALAVVATASRRAAWAADAAALAAAQVTLDGPGAACARAADLAAGNGARLDSCQLADATVSVGVRVDLPGALAGLGSATGRARAGPVSLIPARVQPRDQRLRQTSESDQGKTLQPRSDTPEIDKRW